MSVYDNFITSIHKLLWWWYFTDCKNNTYGLGCTAQCPNCRDDDQCDHVNGSCPNGCAKGTFGIGCEKGCIILLTCFLKKKI